MLRGNGNDYPKNRKTPMLKIYYTCGEDFLHDGI